MQTFGTGREAKEFIVGCIVAEAEREGVSLSELERSMLYFSETAWTLPEMMEKSEAFDRVYDQDDYERKVAGLADAFERRTRRQEPEVWAAWLAASTRLAQEDQYLSVLIARPTRHRFFRVDRTFWSVFAVCVAAVLLIFMFLLLL